MVLVVNNPPANAGDIKDVGSIPGSGRSLGGGHGNPPQSSCLENLMNREAWQAAVHRIARSQTAEHRCTRSHRDTSRERQTQKRDTISEFPPTFSPGL